MNWCIDMRSGMVTERKGHCLARKYGVARNLLLRVIVPNRHNYRRMRRMRWSAMENFAAEINDFHDELIHSNISGVDEIAPTGTISDYEIGERFRTSINIDKT